MTSPSLIFGSILIAFSPTFSLLLLLIFQKPQLVILAVCAAFAYLMSALLSSLIWLIISSISSAINNNNGDSSSNGLSDIGTLLSLAIPGVLCQMFIRCYYVRGYFKVEDVIRKSVAKHEKDTLLAAAASSANNNETSNSSNDNLNGSANNSNNTDEDQHAETNALQLQLNDISCSLSSGCGYALLHALFLYGTLLASESGESNSYNDSGVYAGGGGSTGHGGTLYQDSCAGIPSLINGALIACMFSILDVMWMMICFFGMRRRRHSVVVMNDTGGGGGGVIGSTIQALLGGLTCQGFSDSISGGNAAILVVTITHLLASLVLAPNGGSSSSEDGCKISLPLLGGVVVYVGIIFRKLVMTGHFLPEDQRLRKQGMQTQSRGFRVDQSHHVE